MTVVRLAWGGPVDALAKALGPVTTVRLAASWRGGTEGLENGQGPGDDRRPPALLVAYPYLAAFQGQRERYYFRDWSLDSGAFSAANSGETIDLGEYIATCQKLLEQDPQLVEVFALDVIGDWRASMANTEAMWKAGVEAIPTFHVGEPEECLRAMCEQFPKIALGGAVRYARREEWVRECFRVAWPKRIHGLGMGAASLVLQFPFESVDASSWELGPNAFGNWSAFGGANLKIRGGKKNLRPQVEQVLDLEEKARARWRRVLQELE